MFNKSMKFISLNRGNFYFSHYSFRILWLISGMKVIKKIENFSSISLKLSLLGQKNSDMGCDTTIASIVLC